MNNRRRFKSHVKVYSHNHACTHATNYNLYWHNYIYIHTHPGECRILDNSTYEDTVTVALLQQENSYYFHHSSEEGTKNCSNTSHEFVGLTLIFVQLTLPVNFLNAYKIQVWNIQVHVTSSMCIARKDEMSPIIIIALLQWTNTQAAAVCSNDHHTFTPSHVYAVSSTEVFITGNNSILYR